MQVVVKGLLDLIFDIVCKVGKHYVVEDFAASMLFFILIRTVSLARLLCV